MNYPVSVLSEISPSQQAVDLQFFWGIDIDNSKRGLMLTDKLALSIQFKPYCGYNNLSKQTYRMAMGRSGMDEIRLERRRAARFEESLELLESKKMFSWIKLLMWRVERMVESFWWEFESGRRSFTPTSIVSSDFPVIFHILYKIFVEKGFCLLSRVIVAQKMAFGTHATLSSRKLQSPEDFEPTEQRFVRIQNLVASLVLAL
ncbi:hypothetical protein NC651_000347 [Populus alba x Populus x berolinensis]|nr:hypothetical protein NC651_000347 [Populus alba x Populus x berolinensis]